MDIRMCGGNEKVMALWLFERCSQSIPANDPLDLQEAKWISRGGLIWADNEWKGYGRQYDFTSMYPYLLREGSSIHYKIIDIITEEVQCLISEFPCRSRTL